MPATNRVTPFGEIVAIEQRGLFMGNRGSLHRGRTIVRDWQVRRWITCVLEFRGWVAPKWQPGRWTPLFFWDEAVALAAGHRPCALCRRGDFNAWLDAWVSAFGERPRVDPMDRRLHAERRDGKSSAGTRPPGARSRPEPSSRSATRRRSCSRTGSSRGRRPATDLRSPGPGAATPSC